MSSPGGLDLPDVVELREGAPVPTGVTETPIRGVVVEETADAIRLDLSGTRGIEHVVSVPKKDIQSLKRGDASTREKGKNAELFVRPRLSMAETFYPPRIAQLRAFVEKFPESRHRAEVEALIRDLEQDREEVAAGRVRVDSEWMAASSLTPLDREAWALLQQLSGVASTDFYLQAGEWADRVEGNRGSRFFPDLVEFFQAKSTRARSEVAGASALAAALLATDVVFLRRALAQSQEGRALLDGGIEGDWERGLDLMSQALGGWPQLETARRTLSEAAAAERTAHERALEAAQWDEARRTLDRHQRLAKMVPGSLQEEKKADEWVTQQEGQIEVGEAMQAARKLVDTESLGEARLKIEHIQARLGAFLDPQKVRTLEGMLGEIREKENVREKGRVKAILEGGQLEELAAEVERQRLALAQKPADAPERGAWAELAVDGAVQALRSFQWTVGFRLVMDAWRIDPGNAKAQIALSVMIGGFVVGVLAMVLPTLLVYAAFSNRVELHFFRRRLQAHRLEDERHQERLRSLAQSPEGE